ncbi:hypothetical protein ACLB2K_001224 [Fragaria x ananassa]
MATRRNPSFFKVLIGDHFCEKLKIPRAFLRHFDGNVPEQCQLRILTQTWLVDIEMDNHKFYFQNGWKEFVHENGLKGREFLVFFYDGISEFYVHIYGENACKKEFAEVTRNYVASFREMEEADSDDTSVEILDDFPPSSRRAGLGNKSSLPSHQTHKKDGTSWSNKAVNGAMYKKSGTTSIDGFPAEQFVGGTSSSKRLVQPELEALGRMHIDDDDDDKEEESEEDETEADSENEDEEEEEESDGDEEKSDDSIEILYEFPQCSKAKTMRKSSGLHKGKINSSKTKPQSSITGASGSSSNKKITVMKHKGTGDIIARCRASDFISKSDKPSCSIAMSPSHVHAAWVHFPCLFAERHLKKHCSCINLRVNTRSWCISLYHVKKFVRLQTGWRQFAQANNLKEGDVCVLVLIDNIKYVFDVTIFRATEAANCTLPGGRQITEVQFKSKKEKEKAG